MSSMDSSQLLDPKNDFVFKKIFTAHPDALVHSEARAKALRDEASLIEDALKKGRAEGEARGISIGKVKGEAKMLKRLIERRYQSFPAWAQDKLNAATTEQLEAWADRIFIAESLEDLLVE